MNDNAHVRSTEQLETFLQQTLFYRTKLLRELEQLQLELRRLTNWLTTDARTYWTTQLTRAQRDLKESQEALLRCRSKVREDERRPCTVEKKRVEKAKQRLALCEQRLKTVSAATAAWEREQMKNQAKVQRVGDIGETELLVAANYLREQIDTLQNYLGLRSPAVGAAEPNAEVPRPADQMVQEEPNANRESAQ